MGHFQKGHKYYGHCKAVDYQLFVDVMRDFVSGKYGVYKSAERMGLSVPTFTKRANAFLKGETLPRDWFCNIPEDADKR